ncbi:DUF3784 domain-containing protein [Cytobacillus firmus]|uniref:DUF3784 domain-containing protein n=1 Tax=Cytobacillus firmus TaxID=1399 RepID=UPI001580252D|nr:DUF3784 domain-containing protein [Cytobacillus firmus]MDM5227591.1 DUF3784 domain-containing protein [Cytobacillus sp. NJ13]MBG9546286.1 exonuclease [Cytobacillus firmus]MBG9600768.1 exonuclease [Cytobacillus firmus]MBG9654658.1 exonuclease [Cytobacillus firmus]MDD9314072.1 DUF3784 domain-containing protein [Cytobacillus firmus]
MNQHFIVIGLILLILGYLIGVKKQTWLLSGFNQQRVSDKDKLAKLVGVYNIVMGLLLIGGGFINHPDAQILFPILLVGYVILLGYVNIKMVK